MSLKEIQEEIIGEFAVFEEWLDKYEYLIELGNEMEPIDNQFRTNEHLINGCQSKVWINAELNDGKVYFYADSDAIITKGIVALLIRVLSGRKPDEIMNADLFFIDAIGLTQNLSPTRSNGLLAMVKQMKLYGMAYHAKINK
jgi:cysteine desulfuration protein SufE